MPFEGIELVFHHRPDRHRELHFVQHFLIVSW